MSEEGFLREKRLNGAAQNEVYFFDIQTDIAPNALV